MDSSILLILFDLMDHIHGLKNDGNISLVRSMQEKIRHFTFYDVEMVQFENAGRLKDKHLYQFAEGTT